MKKTFILFLGGLGLCAMVGCSTIKGLGSDIKAVGGWMEKGSSNVQSGNAK